MIFNETLYVIYERHHYRLDSWNLIFLESLYLQRNEDAVAGKGATLHNCFNFIDGTVARICRPVLNQKGSI